MERKDCAEEEEEEERGRLYMRLNLDYHDGHADHTRLTRLAHSTDKRLVAHHSPHTRFDEQSIQSSEQRTNMVKG